MVTVINYAQPRTQAFHPRFYRAIFEKIQKESRGGFGTWGSAPVMSASTGFKGHDATELSSFTMLSESELGDQEEEENRATKASSDIMFQ